MGEEQVDVYELYRRGTELIDHRDYAAAVVPLSRAARTEPNEASIREALGRALLGVRRFGDAAAEFDAIVRLDPTDPFAHKCLAHALLGSGDVGGARRHARLAEALGG